MQLRFTGQTPRLDTPDDQRDYGAGVPNLPQQLLDRHRARVLRPGEAVRAAGEPTPSGTIYRYNTLMMCHRLLGDDSQLDDIDSALATRGWRVAREEITRSNIEKRMQRASFTHCAGGGPSTVDAWDVLQTLRGSVHQGQCGSDILERVRLEHLLVGSALSSTMRGSADDYGAWPHGAGPFLSNTTGADYLNRVPVDLILPMPPRTARDELENKRRIVVAVLDTGVSPTHHAFDISERADGEDTFVVVDNELQDELSAHSDPAAPVLRGPWDEPYVAGSVSGTIATHYGHGTFITGIIRQAAPDAQVRSIRVMHNDGLVYENECVAALTRLADEVERARDGDRDADPVDVVSLSFGYVDEDPHDVPVGGLASVIRRLTSLGVPVVCAAGNFSTERPFYPAAFAADKPQAAPVVSVGALNPNGTVAMFSNGGSWLTCYATGAGIVSTVPSDIDGSIGPAIESGLGEFKREGFDPDDFGTGYAIWNGTSFAAPFVAARLAAAYGSVTHPYGHSVDSVAQRVRKALAAIGG